MAGQNHMACCCGCNIIDNDVSDPDIYGWQPPITVGVLGGSGSWHHGPGDDCGGTTFYPQYGRIICRQTFSVQMKVTVRVEGDFSNADAGQNVDIDWLEVGGASGGNLIWYRTYGTEGDCDTSYHDESNEVILDPGSYDFRFQTFSYEGDGAADCIINFTILFEAL